MTPQVLGHYRIESTLGAGGMGVVYQATDSRLGRRVAIKVLHSAVVGTADGLARLEREARLLASLNHTNIAAIYGLERANGVNFLVLEHVPGETLAQRLARGALPPKEALAIARQIAEALEVAHGCGVVHRDLKPSNVKITPDGQVKVLDFGLAKALEPAVSLAAADGATTVTAPADLTGAGVIAGTLAYMSPEQASGRAVDQRTDLWAFGCVLFEMLTGTRTFAGDSATDLLVHILDREPDWNALPAGTPPNIRRMLRRCLAKETRNRMHHAADARLELDDALAEGQPGASGLEAAAPPRQRRGAAWLAVASSVVLMAAGIGVWSSTRNGVSAPARVVRFAFDLPAGGRIAPSWGGVNIAFSRDGRTLLYPTLDRRPVGIYARRLDEPEGQPLAAMKGLGDPLFSPDGRWLAATDYPRDALVKVPLSGGAPIRLGPMEMAFQGAWGDDGFIYWSNGLVSGIVRTPVEGGDTEPVTTVEVEAGERNHRFAQLLPGGKAVMFTVATGDIDSYDDARIDLMELATKKRTTVVKGGTYARYSPSGHLVYARGGSLYAVAFDAGRLRVKGTPVKVLDGVLMSTNIGSAFFDVSPTGDLAYAQGPTENGKRSFHWVDRRGNETPVPLPARPYLNPRLSPNERYLAVEVEGPNHDLYMYDFQREVLARVSTDGISHGPIWTPDAKRLAFRTWKAGKMTVAWMPADRSGPMERLVNYAAWQSAESFTPDGRHLFFAQVDRSTFTYSVWSLAVDGDRQPREFARSGGGARMSPDGRWLVYCSLETGRAEIYVQGWPEGPKIQISAEGGTDPLWSARGDEIFYRNGSKMMAVSVDTRGSFRAGKPVLLWTGDYMHGLSSSCGLRGPTVSSYDVSRDGQRFLMIRDNDQQMFATRIAVIVNWSQEVERMVADGQARTAAAR